MASNWLEQYKSIKLKPTTYDCCETLIKNNITPEIGDNMLKDLKVEHIQRFYNKMYNRGSGASTSTIRKIHVILKSALNQAVTNELLFKNPVSGVELPEHKQKEIKVFTQEEQSSFCEKAKDYRLYPAFIVNLDSGLRLGEILALRWNDIDFTKGIISLNKNLVMIKDQDEKSKNNYKLFEQDTTKTKRGRRKIPLKQRSILLSKELKLKQLMKSNIVFCSEVGTYVAPRNYERTFQKVVEKANIGKCNSNTLRHSFATRLFEIAFSSMMLKVIE